MKLNQYVKKSLTRQFITIFSLFTLLFSASSISLFFAHHEINDTYYKERKALVEKQQILAQIDDAFNLTVLDTRSYIAFENNDFKDGALAQLPILNKLHKEFESISVTQEDKAYARELREMIDFYFSERLADTITSIESGKKNELIQKANSLGFEKVSNFQKYSDSYLKSVQNSLNNTAIELSEKQSFVQYVFIALLVVLLFIFFLLIRIMLKRVGQPLAQFANAANEIALGKEAVIEVEDGREDELGALSIAFRKMIKSIQDNEQDLLAQNEELIAQQDELQAQQMELESMLEAVRENERKLERRNKLTNEISNSLQKDVVLESIVFNMCDVLEADRGVIVMLNEEATASFGVSKEGIHQFRKYIENGLHDRLKKTKKVFTIKRELQAEEKGYHTAIAYGYDLYLPVLSSLNEVAAIMVFTRFGSPFHQNQMEEEYEALSKQIGISLEKIRLFEASEENRKLNQSIMDTVKEGIQLIDWSGRVIQVNKQLSDIFGCHEGLDSLIGLPWETWTDSMKEFVEDESGFISFLTCALNSSEATSEEYSYSYRMKNSKQVIKMYFEGLYHGNERTGTVIVHRDITKEFEVDQMKSEFVSTVSHELRTPLASILGFTELMLNRELKPVKQTKYLTTIYNEAKRLTALINDFLDVQRMESGKQTYEKKFIKIIPILEKVIETQQFQTSIHQIELQQSINNDIILGDRSRMVHVFTNLLNNAIKYSPDGGEIKVKIYQEDDQLKVDITDHGLGIPEDALDKLFNKFFRVDNSDRRTIGGTGLGLAIVQEIMKAHDGMVYVKSEYGKGSTFTLSFPTVETTHIRENVIPPSTENNEFNIMVVEDDHSLAELIYNELSESGFHVTSFAKGEEALDYIQKETPDAIVLDILLEEEIDGWSIMKNMKQNERLQNIPIIISTALDEKEKGFSLGANDYLIKPYKPSQLSHVIHQTLSKTGKIGQILIPEEHLNK
ncbi:ATP-binding protein [Bacillus sp. S/N-304-OC-R1]|uniref:ATP-binding protein n=1 Tax=Bacillus sp. S/N-304-OC-R1 TaxID=2758034 RepID=UPI001C8EEEC8|nr:ATP-binding protein [Bacillus sp. S/N-304-OC-R1]MBY0123258.1 response regulator [Bacillus sp. S/N-304-OC-R1]